MTLSGKRIARGNAAFSVFERICITPGSTRAKVASEVGLSIASVGNAVDRLIDEGLVSAYQGKSLGGRPAEILFPSRRSVFITDVRGENARAFCLDQTCGVLFFDERSFCSCADTADALRDLIGRFAESPEFSRDELFAVRYVG